MCPRSGCLEWVDVDGPDAGVDGSWLGLKHGWVGIEHSGIVPGVWLGTYPRGSRVFACGGCLGHERGCGDNREAVPRSVMHVCGVQLLATVLGVDDGGAGGGGVPRPPVVGPGTATSASERVCAMWRRGADARARG